MESSKKKENKIMRLQAGSEMTIYTATDLKAEFYESWDKASEVELNLSQVEELDSAGVQILLQLKSDSERFNKPVRFVEHSPVVLEVLELLNLIGRFSDPVVLSANRRDSRGRRRKIYLRTGI